MKAMMFTRTWLAIPVLLAMMLGCQTTPQSTSASKIEATAENVDKAYDILAENRIEIANEWSGKSFEEFERSVFREPGTGLYIVNGDVPISDRKHLQEFFERQVQAAGMEPRGLIIHQVGGVDAAWDDLQKKALTYCVSNTFGTRQTTVISAMASATSAWEAVADVNFTHVSNEDTACTETNNQVLFDVRPVSNGGYLARAFFPGDPRNQRNVLIDNSSFGLDPNENLTLVGILRHELGHALGFRHEHTRPESGTCFEDPNWRPLTNYDAFSVMHYPQCNGQGDWSLTLTHLDNNGAACVYGPAAGFAVDTSICTPPSPVPDPCGEQTVTKTGNVAQNQEVQLGQFSVLPGTKFKAAMTGTGDPDLYVRFFLEPNVDDYDCRPFLSGANETCDLTVPADASSGLVMVRGFTAGDYQVQITHTPSP